ncbi:hypothetical protein BHE74_00003945 [Ensete ventricosum]|nr:hypothetical protein BHE74_00003945 [Ensete ventricosum]
MAGHLRHLPSSLCFLRHNRHVPFLFFLGGCPNLNSAFLGDRSRICLSDAPFSRFRFLRKPVECKESRIGKRPIEVPTNVTITLDGQDLKVKGPLGELSRTYPREVKVERDESGLLKVFKAVETRRANQMHGLFR